MVGNKFLSALPDLSSDTGIVAARQLRDNLS